MYHILLFLFLIVSIILIGLIIMQHDNNISIGNSVNIDVSRIILSSSNSGSFLTRLTSLLASLFFVLSIVLGNLSANFNSKEKKYSKTCKVFQKKVENNNLSKINNSNNDDIPQ